MSYKGGILLFTLGRERQKLFEIYDRIGLGTIGRRDDRSIILRPRFCRRERGQRGNRKSL